LKEKNTLSSRQSTNYLCPNFTAPLKFDAKVWQVLKQVGQYVLGAPFILYYIQKMKKEYGQYRTAAGAQTF